MASTKVLKVSMGLTLDGQLKTILAELARKNHRSLSSEICYRLERSLGPESGQAREMAAALGAERP
jgi:Arc-like DNA binding domain